MAASYQPAAVGGGRLVEAAIFMEFQGWHKGKGQTRWHYYDGQNVSICGRATPGARPFEERAVNPKTNCLNCAVILKMRLARRKGAASAD